MKASVYSPGGIGIAAKAVTLSFPFLSPWIIKFVAATKYDWMHYGNYYSLISLAFVASGVSAFFLFKKKGKIFGAGLAIALVYILIGTFLPSSRCEEYLILNNSKPDQAAVNECN